MVLPMATLQAAVQTHPAEMPSAIPIQQITNIVGLLGWLAVLTVFS
jgi:hypothetical protein